MLRVKTIIGWREWVSLPELKIKKIKAKIDSGAKSSSLHAFDIRRYSVGRKEFLKFKVQTDQKHDSKIKACHAQLIEYRRVKSSNGHVEKRPVILTQISFLDSLWDIELTLTNRKEMGFRMLLGRDAFKDRFLVDAGNSYYGLKKNKTRKLSL